MGGGRARRLGAVDEAERTSHYARLPHTLAARFPLQFLDQIRDP